MFRQKNLSKDFILKIIEKAAGKVPQKMLEDFLSSIEKESNLHYFTKSSESNLLRAIQNQFDIAFFINECLKYPLQIEFLIALSNNSNYLTDILVRNPEYFHWIINPSVLEQKLDDKYFKSILEKTVSPFRSFDSKVNAIRNFKRKEMLRIGLKDIYLKEDLKNITLYLSYLANSISSVLFELCYKEILEKHKIEKTTRKYVLFSLGKLGGNELNYSSDIDLVAFYDKNSLINRKIYYSQILSETILLFIDTASKKTGAGFLYRVDFRLRPDGRNAPLCGSYSEYIRYYETRGEDWERQMLIKANYLCGSESLYKKFSDSVSRFIYPATFSVSPIEQIRKLKSSIELRNKSDDNIKLVSGGIRDIEFSIQALQLLNGGKNAEIRTGNSLDAIDNLLKKNILSEEEALIFNDAYNFYRKSEHYLQLMNDLQTHKIPADGEIAEKLANFLKFKDLKSFKEQLNLHKMKVQTIYNSIVGIMNTSDAKNEFEKITFLDYKRAKGNFEFLRTGKSLFDKKQFDNRTTSSFEKIEQELLISLAVSIDPDIILENFARIIRNANFPQIWFNQFSDNKFFQLFLSLCERSQRTIDLFAEDKILRDTFLSRECLASINNRSFSNLTLKDFHFRASIQLTDGIIKAESFADLYTDYLNQSISSLTNKFVRDKNWKDNFFIAAMGSFGSSELSFNSDIDLVFVVSDIKNYPEIQKDFQKLLQNFKDNLPGHEIDCRLRPEGKSSQLVWDIEDYKKYFSHRARVWELQAFTKCRFIIGDGKLFNNFYTHYIQTVKGKDTEQIKKEMFEMRKKLYPPTNTQFNIKKSSGGIADIDFILSFLILSSPDLLIERNENRIISSFDMIEKISNKNINFDQLKRNYYSLKQIELFNQVIFNSRLSKIPIEELKIKKLSKECGFSNSKLFLDKLHLITEQTKKYYQNIFN
jgi:glutamate-ammonia-ligase adenylyltransferase